MAQMLEAARPPGGLSDVAVDLVRSAVGMESAFESSFTDVSISRVATQYLLMATEVQLMHSGELTGYYPEGVFTQASSSIRESASWPGEFDSLAEFLGTFDEDLPLFLTPEMYLGIEALWRDAVTPDLARCIELVMFAVQEVWESSIAEVAHLSRRLEQNPSLSVSAEEIDRVTWALTGAADLSWDDPNSIGWSVVRRAFWSEMYETRRVQLDEVRSHIIGLQDVLTADESAAATRSLLRRLNPQRIYPA